jgi:HNH endonuclease
VNKLLKEALDNYLAVRKALGRPKSLEDSFWRFVIKAEGCWEWGASCGNHGYGQLTYLQQKYLAHRLSWELNCGPIGEGLCVLHKCDNRKCVNPDHLFLGTKVENLEDMTRKGRRVRGQQMWKAVLTEESVKYILKSPLRNFQLAQELGVCSETIGAVRRRVTWKHVQMAE